MTQNRTQSDASDHLSEFMNAGLGIMRQLETAMEAAHDWQRQGLGWPAMFAMPFAAPWAGLFELQRWYFEQVARFWGLALPGSAAAPGGRSDEKDKRFRDEAWQNEPFYEMLKKTYLAGAKYLHDFVEAADVDPRTKMQLRFYARQFTDAISPSNFPATNPEVIRKALETRSESLAAGMKNLIDDIQKGRITRVDESAFEVGGNLAATPGSIVYENELIQLIQYAPKTEAVRKTPLLMVPPCINKYYLLDLGAGNSLVEYAVEQGYSVFLISWRSATPEIETLKWDDYLERGVMRAIEAVADITGAAKTHALGFCVGGTILGCTAAVLAARGEDRFASLTFLTTMLDFSDPGEIGILIDEPYVAMREATIGNGGILPGRELAFTFGTLRANDLIWRYVVDNYLKGATPDAFDLLYWDSDSVSLPGPMYCWYLRNAYLGNKIKIPGATVQAGVPVDLSAIKWPTYVLASREDHIVPWRSAYATTGLVGSEEVRFALAASGHVAGVINPPARKKRCHWINDRIAATPEEWLEGAKEHPGSWWPDWIAWLNRRSPGIAKAPKEPGNRRYPPLEPAPGRYVKEKAA